MSQPKGEHWRYKYSITIHSDDYPLVAAIRGLAWFSQQDGNKQIAWGGTKKKDWEMGHHKVTFHFDHAEYRDNFLRETNRLFLSGWEKTDQSDTNPAIPQN
jgi:hypothetical protein